MTIQKISSKGEVLTKISIIIPVFNTEKYLKECLDSVFSQSFKDFEVICINDGSTDNSRDILNEYASKYDCLHIIDQENSGLSASRNVGMDKAKGKYILFLDSDDILEESVLSETYVICEEKSLDLLIFKMIEFDDETRVRSKYDYFEMDLLKSHVQDNVFCYEDAKDKLFRISVTAQGKLYKRELLEGIRFIQGIIFEDNPFFIELYLNAKRVYFYDKYLYLKRVRSDSIIHSYFEKFSDVITVYNIIHEIVKKYGIYDEVRHKLFNRQCRDIYLRFSQLPEEYKEDFYNKFKQDFLNKKEAYENEGTIDLANKRSLEIFYNLIESENHVEFELSIEVFDLKRKVKKLKKKNRKLSKKIDNYPKSKNYLKKLFKH